MSESFFTSTNNLWFSPTEHARGPWDEHACHAGPPTALLARAVEQLLPAQRLTRLTVDLQRPVPFLGFRIESSIVKRGRTVSLSEARLIDSDNRVVVTASGLHLTTVPQTDMPTFHQSFGSAHEAIPGAHPINKSLHDKPAFNGTGVQVRYPAGQTSGPGPTTAWVRTVPLLDNETPSPFQRICPLADCGNAFGRNAEADTVTFMNADLTIVLHRDPVGDWLGTQSVGYWEPDGIGMADALLFDEQGVVGRAVQSLILRMR